jgi:hypothetical protein
MRNVGWSGTDKKKLGLQICFYLQPKNLLIVGTY